MTITTYTDREIALRQQLAAMTVTATEYQQAADKMAMAHKVERDTLRQQLAEAQAQCKKLEQELDAFDKSENSFMRKSIELEALIKASRKQEAAFWMNETGQLSATKGWAERQWPSHKLKPLFAAPVVALDVLKELWWIRTIFAKDLKTGGVVIKDIQGKEISKWIDRVDALGGAA